MLAYWYLQGGHSLSDLYPLEISNVTQSFNREQESDVDMINPCNIYFSH